MGKKAKEHRKKVAKRNAKIDEAKKKQQKSAMDFLMKLIQKEKDKGLFNGEIQPLPGAENNIEPLTVPSTDQSLFNGPQI